MLKVWLPVFRLLGDGGSFRRLGLTKQSWVTGRESLKVLGQPLHPVPWTPRGRHFALLCIPHHVMPCHKPKNNQSAIH